MADYRLYCIRDGHFFSCETFAAEDDEAAIAESRRRQPNQAAELWSGKRRIRTFEAAPSAEGDS